MANQPAGGKKKPPPSATTRGRASTTQGGETQDTPDPGTIELSAAVQTSLASGTAHRGNTPAPHLDRPPEGRVMTPGMLSLTGNNPSDDERSEIVEDITPLPQLSRTPPLPEGVTFRHQPRPNTPADLFSVTSQGHPSTTRVTDSSTWVQSGGTTSITLEDVQSLMQIQAKQFQQSMTDNINRVQRNFLDMTDELRSDQEHAVQNLRSTLRNEMEQTTQHQERFIINQEAAVTELARMIREDVLPTLRTRNVQANTSTTPAQAPPQDQQPAIQANVPPVTPVQLPAGQQQPVTPAPGLLATTIHQRNPYESMMAQTLQIS
jgi:hypothetical protein